MANGMALTNFIHNSSKWKNRSLKTKPHLSFDKWGLVFNYWLSLSSIFTASTLRIYSSLNAGIFGRIEPSAVYTGASFFISPTLFLESIHYILSYCI
jgi:hypothetical protein